MNLASFLDQHPKRHLIFDCDQTLLYLQLPWRDYLTQVKQIIHRYDPDLTAWEPTESAIRLVNGAVKKYGEPLSQELIAAADAFETSRLTGVEYHPPLLDFIRHHSQTYEYSLWTSNCATTLEPLLKEVGIWSIFQSHVTRERVRYVKPDPEGFQYIYQAGRPLTDYVMIGDSSADAGAAKASGIDFWQVEPWWSSQAAYDYTNSSSKS